eukprot:Lankesteria_metandrocarpae@DN5339_c0_g2_i5.p5
MGRRTEISSTLESESISLSNVCVSLQRRQQSQLVENTSSIVKPVDNSLLRYPLPGSGGLHDVSHWRWSSLLSTAESFDDLWKPLANNEIKRTPHSLSPDSYN